MAEYVNPPFDTEPIQVEQSIYDYIRDTFPDWSPKEPHLITLFTEAIAAEIAELQRIAADVPPEIFQYFGRLVGIIPGEAQAAQGSTTWTMIDNAGYTIPAGTSLRMLIGGDEYAVFETVEDVVVPPGSTTTAVGGVEIRAVEEGSDANGLSTPVELIDILDYVQSVAIATIPVGGTDEEDIDTYLGRLATRLQLLADRPILPRDFEIFALTISGIARALAVDGYDPSDESYDNERMVTMIALDENGAAVSGALEDEMVELLEAAREVNFIVNTASPTFTAVAVVVTVRAYPGFDLTALDAEVTAAVQAYLHPTNWGQPRHGDADLSQWINTPVVRYFEVAEVVNNVPGVDYIESLTLDGNANTDVNLPGVAPMPSVASTVAVTVNAP